jgi:hypothetical protein
MSEPQIFFGEQPHEGARAAMVEGWRLFTGSLQCANEVADASEEVEEICGPTAAMTTMSIDPLTLDPWVN